jgi:pimeloyl-ACP methyl ester carboxylesterase
VTIPVDGAHLEGDLAVPDEAVGIVAFAHGSGSSRHSPRNRQVATRLRDARLGTLLFDLLSSDEEAEDLRTRELRSVEAPTLLIVGGADPVVIDLNREAREQMRREVRLEIVEGAGHLFEEPGALDRVADLARDWSAGHLAGGPGSRER